jgi:hypothetical protein
LSKPSQLAGINNCLCHDLPRAFQGQNCPLT